MGTTDRPLDAVQQLIDSGITRPEFDWNAVQGALEHADIGVTTTRGRIAVGNTTFRFEPGTTVEEIAKVLSNTTPHYAVTRDPIIFTVTWTSKRDLRDVEDEPF